MASGVVLSVYENSVYENSVYENSVYENSVYENSVYENNKYTETYNFSNFLISSILRIPNSYPLSNI